MKKLIILISVIIIFFIFFLFMYISPRNYEKIYEVDKINITESYNKEKEYYTFTFKYKKNKYQIVTEDKYINKRGLIKKVKIESKENIVCLIPESKYITFYPICYDGESYVDYNLTNINFEIKNEIKAINDEYKDIKINYLNEKTFLVWNYKGFNYLKDNDYKQINFLNADTYNLDLIAKVNNYLLIPDYNSNHSFQKMFIINLKNGEIKKWDLKYEIYFNSYVVGSYGKSVYLFDSKNEIEYELRPDKMKMRKIRYKALINDEWQSITLGDLRQKIEFSYDNVYNYEVINNKLYLLYEPFNTKTLISNQKVKDIVYIDNDTVYYLVDEKLYMYNKSMGEILLLEYFEWNFNYKNMIFIY